MKGVVKVLKEESIKKWSKGRCKGRIKGYERRLREVAKAMLLLNDIGKLSDDILKDLYIVAMELSLNRHNLINRTVNNFYVKDFRAWDTVFLYRLSCELGNKDVYGRLKGLIKEFRNEKY